MNRKGKYSGRHMTIYGYVLPGAISLANWAARTSKLSEKAKHKLRVLDCENSLLKCNFGTIRLYEENKTISASQSIR